MRNQIPARVCPNYASATNSCSSTETRTRTSSPRCSRWSGDVPRLMRPAELVSRWRIALLRARGRFGTYEELADAMRRHGFQLGSDAIRMWVVGVAIGPRDPEDVRRLGAVLGDDYLVECYGDVHDAIRELRGAHVRLGRRLAHTARHVGPAVRAGRIADDELIDERAV